MGRNSRSKSRLYSVLAMRKLLHRILIVLCVLLAGVLVAFWNRSYSRYDRLHYVQWQETGDVVSARLSGFDMSMGCIQYLSIQMISTNDPNEIALLQNAAGRFQPDGTPYRSLRQTRNLVRTTGDSMLAAMGFEFRLTGPEDLVARRVELAIPFWSMFLILLAYPIACYIRGIVVRHRTESQALTVCPRCGEPIAARATHCACCDRPVVVIAEA